MRASALGSMCRAQPHVHAQGFGVVPARRMVWGDGSPIFRGVRTFVLEPRDNASTDFVMEERFSGVVFALTKSMLPDFRPIFEAYANDLKREAQRVAHEREKEKPPT